MAALAAMMPGLLASLALGAVTPEDQDARYATWAARRRPDDGAIDWQGSAAEAWRMVRACGDPYPGAFTMLGDQRIVLTSAEPVGLADHRAAIAGQIVHRTGDSFTVRCGDGNGLRVTAWRWERPTPPPLHARLGPSWGEGSDAGIPYRACARDRAASRRRGAGMRRHDGADRRVGRGGRGCRRHARAGAAISGMAGGRGAAGWPSERTRCWASRTRTISICPPPSWIAWRGRT